jgi:hypothetical protein
MHVSLIGRVSVILSGSVLVLAAIAVASSCVFSFMVASM